MPLEQLEPRLPFATLPQGFIETPVAAGLASATAMEIAPNNDLWVLEQAGLVKRFRPGSTTADVIANMSTLGLSPTGERGLLGIAFDPDYAATKRVFLYYTATTPNIHNRISAFTVIDTDAADYYFAGTSTTPTDAGSSGTPTQTVIFELDALSGATNHNGGAIHFGPDGKLYAAVGENATTSHAQTLANLHGKMLRINKDGTIPTDNPFYNTATGQERAIWALGLRNPFTFAFQPGTGRMFINDVGAGAWEEINDGVAGANYGWPGTEGNAGTPPSGPGTYRAPLYAYPHNSSTEGGFSIAGGAFYNANVQQFPASYAGDYFFADYVRDWINVLDISTSAVTRFASGVSGNVDLRVTTDGSLIYLARELNQAFRVTYTIGNPWHNYEIVLDVSGDDATSPLDALMIFNFLNSIGPSEVPPDAALGPPFYDTNNDRFVSPNDALLIFNFLNLGQGEGEGNTDDTRVVNQSEDSAAQSQGLGYAVLSTEYHSTDLIGAQRLSRKLHRL